MKNIKNLYAIEKCIQLKFLIVHNSFMNNETETNVLANTARTKSELNILLTARLEEKKEEMNDNYKFDGSSKTRLIDKLKELGVYDGRKKFDESFNHVTYAGLLVELVHHYGGKRWGIVYRTAGATHHTLDTQLKKLGWLEERITV